MGACSCVSNSFLGVSGFIYAVLGLAIVVGASVTFFTAYGEIITPVYAGTGLGGGILILLIGLVGMLAACKKRGVCWLWVFTVWTFLLLVLVIATIVAMFKYEDLLHEAAKVNAEGGVIDATDVVSNTATDVVRTLTHNAYDACNATTLATATPYEYSFYCPDSDFTRLGNIIDESCYETVTINATVGSPFAQCYSGDYLKDWIGSVPLVAYPSSAQVLAVLRSPKGLWCACSSTFIDEYVIHYIRYTKYVAAGVIVFFAIAFVCCVAQLCKRGCCGGRAREEALQQPGYGDPTIQMTYPDPKVPGGRSKKYSANLGGGGYVARP